MGQANKQLVFFDVDSLEQWTPESDGAHPPSALPGLGFRPRVAPLAPHLNRLYRFAREQAHPLLFSVCCSGRTPEPDAPDIAHIPWSGPAPRESRAHPSHLFHVHKVPTRHREGSPEAMHRAMIEKFSRNQGLQDFITHYGAQRWVVFGNGAACCVQPALDCLLAARQAVTLLYDLLVPNAGPDAEAATLAMVAHCEARGAHLQSFAAFCLEQGIA